MQNFHNKYDVIIVGLGPTGAVLANILGGLGRQVLCIEKEKSLIQEISNAIHLFDKKIVLQ